MTNIVLPVDIHFIKEKPVKEEYKSGMDGQHTAIAEVIYHTLEIENTTDNIINWIHVDIIQKSIQMARPIVSPGFSTGNKRELFTKTRKKFEKIGPYEKTSIKIKGNDLRLYYIYGEYNNGDKFSKQFHDPLSFTGATSEGKSVNDSKCFVITAVYGNPNHPVVVTYREFRDNILYKYHYGRIFIDIYGKFGPVLANILEKFPFLKFLVRFPIYAISKLISKIN